MELNSKGREQLRRNAFLAAGTIGTGAILFQSGCEDRQVGSHEVAKEFASASVAVSADGPSNAGIGVTPIDARIEPLSWTAPAHWKTKPASPMRRATFAVPMTDGTEADLSISVLGGAAGGLPANVNRWRTQLGLPELGADEIARAAETIPAGGITFTLFDLAGKANGGEVRMLSAVAEFEGQSWFFKLTGNDHCVGVEKPAFVAFLRSVKTR